MNRLRTVELWRGAPRTAVPRHGASAARPTARPDEELIRTIGRRVGMAIQRGWWIAALLIICGGGLSIVWDFTRPARYEAKAQLWMAGSIVIPKSAYYTEPWENFLQTQAMMIRSPRVARGALARVPGLASQDDLPMLDVHQPKDASVLDLTAVGRDAGIAKTFLGAVIESYFGYRQDVQRTIRDDTVTTLIEQLARQENELNRAEAELAAFQATNDLAGVAQEKAAAAAYVGRLREQVSTLRLQEEWLTETPAREIYEWSAGVRSAAGLGRATSLAKLAALEGGDTALYRQTRDRVELLQVQREEMSAVLKPRHPKCIALDEAIAELEELSAALAESGARHVQQTLSSLRTQLRGLERTLGEWERRLTELGMLQVEGERLMSTVDRQRALYQRLDTMVQEVDSSRSVELDALTVVDEPAVEALPRWRRWRALGGGIAGGLLSLVPILAIEFRRRPITVAAQLPPSLRQLVWAGIPSIAPGGCMPLEGGGGPGRRAVPSPQGQVLEAYRALRAGLLCFESHDEARRAELPGEQRMGRAVVVVSRMPEEGASTIVAGLAHVLALAGNKVLLVDANLRQPALHQFFGLEAGPGLAEVLDAQVDWRACARPVAPDGLRVLTAGRSARAAGELLVQPALARMIREAQNEFDFVLVDSTPVGAAADVLSLGPLTDGVVLVVKTGGTYTTELRNAVRYLADRRMPVRGIVLNQV